MKNPNQKPGTNIRFLTQLALLVAIQILLAATPLGYLPLGPVDITIMHIPALVGAVVLGPAAGAALGGVFGLTSIAVATMRGGPFNAIFSPFLSGSGWSLVISLIPRILCGLLAALVFQALRKARLADIVAAGIAAAVGSLTNTVLVLGGIYLFFGEIYAGLVGIAHNALLAALVTVAATNGLFEAAAAVVICAGLVKPLKNLL